MGDFHTLRINYEMPPVDLSGDWLRIEQPVEKQPPASGFLGWLQTTGRQLTLNTLAEYFEEYKSVCEEDGCLTVEIQIYKSRPTLAYTMTTSYGELSERYIHSSNRKRSEVIRMASSIDLGVQITGSISAAWEGPVIGADSSEVLPVPEVMVDGSVLSWGQEVSGVLRLKYSEEHDTYTLTIAPRPEGEYEADDLAGAYEATVMAIWADGVEVHEVLLPSMDGKCNGGRSNALIDPDDPDDGQCYDLLIEYDGCLGDEIVSKKLIPVPCPEDPEFIAPNEA